MDKIDIISEYYGDNRTSTVTKVRTVQYVVTLREGGQITVKQILDRLDAAEEIAKDYIS